jgi:hypothetical protein
LFLLARGQNMLGIEGMTFALRTDGSGRGRALAATKVAKIMYPFLGLIQLTLARKRTFSPRLADCVKRLHRLRTALKTSADDSVTLSAMNSLVDFLQMLLGMKMDGDAKVGLAFQVCISLCLFCECFVIVV